MIWRYEEVPGTVVDSATEGEVEPPRDPQLDIGAVFDFEGCGALFLLMSSAWSVDLCRLGDKGCLSGVG